MLGEVVVKELPLYFIPLESDILSLEMRDSFSGLCLRKDPTSAYASAKGLMLLQKQYGLFPRILGKGENAKMVADLLQRMRKEEDVNASAGPAQAHLTSFGLTPSSLIENLIVIDREVDFPTLLSTQLTYEGLIDEAFGIDNNQTEVESSILGGAPLAQQQNSATQAPSTASKRKVQLDSTSTLYPSIRDSNFATIGPTLNRTARRLQSDQATIKNEDQSIADLKSFVSKLPSYQAEQASLKIHTSIAEEIMKITRSDAFARMLEVQQNLLAGSDPGSMNEHIEELISRDAPLQTVLRLICLESCLHNGIRQRDLDSFKRQIFQAYGFQHVITVANLGKMGLLVPRESHRGYLNPIGSTAGQTATDWNAVRKALQLWAGDVQEADPNDIAYVFSGFAPLSVRLVQCVLQKTYVHNLSNANKAKAAQTGTAWKGFEEPLSRIRGATVDVIQRGNDVGASNARNTLRGNKEGPKVTVVFFLGGITYAEIAALRFVSGQLREASGRTLVIATTGILNGKKAINVAVEERKFGE